MQLQLYAKPRVEPATLRDGPVRRRGGAIVACAHCSSGLLLDQFLRLLFFLHQCAAALSAVVTAIAVAAVIHAPRCGTEAWHSASAPALHAAAPPPQSLLANWLGAVLPEMSGRAVLRWSGTAMAATAMRGWRRALRKHALAQQRRRKAPQRRHCCLAQSQATIEIGEKVAPLPPPSRFQTTAEALLRAVKAALRCPPAAPTGGGGGNTPS